MAFSNLKSLFIILFIVKNLIVGIKNEKEKV